VSPLPLLKLAQALAHLKPFPVAGMAHRSYSGLPETFSPPFSILCPWIHGLFPAIEFVVAFSLSLSLPNSGDPTAVERNNATRSRLFPWSDPLRPIQIARLRSRITLPAHAPDALARLPAPKPSGAGPARSACPPPLSLTLPGPPVSARPLARALGRRSNLSRWF
jgi:hypothetical protein